LLVLVNLLVSAALVWFWRDAYSDHLWAYSGQLRAGLLRGVIPVLLIPLFLHATPSHLLGNMVGLTASGAAVEEFYGFFRTLLFYVVTGLCGATLSLVRENPVLSVGASGAIMGLYGVILMFLLRYRGRFSPRERMKTTRVYLPLLVLALFPSLFGADFYSHAGGFLGGILLGWLVSPAQDRLARLGPSEASSPRLQAATAGTAPSDPSGSAGTAAARVTPSVSGDPTRPGGSPR
jgi:rhomboid protease GluP